METQVTVLEDEFGIDYDDEVHEPIRKALNEDDDYMWRIMASRDVNTIIASQVVSSTGGIDDPVNISPSDEQVEEIADFFGVSSAALVTVTQDIQCKVCYGEVQNDILSKNITELYLLKIIYTAEQEDSRSSENSKTEETDGDSQGSIRIKSPGNPGSWDDVLKIMIDQELPDDRYGWEVRYQTRPTG